MQISFNCQTPSCSKSTKFNNINQACIWKGDADSSKMKIGASDIFILPYRIQGSYSINCYHLSRPYLLFLAPLHTPPIYREGNRFMESVIPTPPLLTCFFMISHCPTSLVSVRMHAVLFYLFPSFYFSLDISAILLSSDENQHM